MKIKVRVKPSARTEEVNREGDAFIVKVREPPKEGRANRAVIRVLADYFGVPQGRVTIISGLRDKDKVVEIADQ